MNIENENLKSILLINDYLSVCKMKDPNCNSTNLVKIYLNQKIKSILEDTKLKTIK